LGAQEPLVWDQNTINKLKYVDNEWDRVVKLWFDRVKEGYIVEFVIECSESFNNVERKFVIDPRKKTVGRDLVVDQDVVCREGANAHGAR
jgi:hypothetical protein